MRDTSNPADKGLIEFCLLGRVVKAETLELGDLRLTYADGRTAFLTALGYEADCIGIAFGFAESPSGDMLIDCDPGDESDYRERGAESGERQDDAGNTMGDFTEPSKC